MKQGLIWMGPIEAATTTIDDVDVAALARCCSLPFVSRCSAVRQDRELSAEHCVWKLKKKRKSEAVANSLSGSISLSFYFFVVGTF